MGAMGCHREKGLTDREYFARQYENETNKILACTSKNRAFYAALQTSMGVVAIVVSFQWFRSSDSESGNWENFVYKPMDETCGPNEAECPQRILDLLDPVDVLYGDGSGAQNAADWRATCEQAIAKAAKKHPVRKGDTVTFSQTINFQGGTSSSLDSFTFVKGSTFSDVKYASQRYKISNWRKRDYRNLSHEARLEAKADKAASKRPGFKPSRGQLARPSSLAG